MANGGTGVVRLFMEWCKGLPKGRYKNTCDQHRKRRVDKTGLSGTILPNGL